MSICQPVTWSELSRFKQLTTWLKSCTVKIKYLGMISNPTKRLHRPTHPDLLNLETKANMRTYFYTDQNLTYDGRQLAPHWIYRTFDILGDAIIAFVGPCKVDLSEMVDLEDVKALAPIYSPLMLHCIAEFFHADLELAVYRQRLLIVTAKELLEELTKERIQRKGDDLYATRTDGTPGKLSVSIATASPTSTLIHTGFNIQTQGTPVPTTGLAELNVETDAFAAELLRRYAAEVQDIWLARCKVRAVTE